jgi:hypothetical protein
MPVVSTIKMKARQFLQLGQDPPGVRLEVVDGLEGGEYAATGRAVGTGIIRVPPFEDLDIRIEQLWRK